MSPADGMGGSLGWAQRPPVLEGVWWPYLSLEAHRINQSRAGDVRGRSSAATARVARAEAANLAARMRTINRARRKPLPTP